MESRPELNGQSIYNIIDFHSPCYAGLRTIAVKLKSINNYTNFLANISSTTNPSEAVQILTNNGLPKALKEIAADLFFARSVEHRQDLVEKRFAKNISGFKRDIAQLEVYPCDLCRRLRKKSELQKFKPTWNAIFADPNDVANEQQASNGEEPVSEQITCSFEKVCQQCARNLRESKIPTLSVTIYLFLIYIN